MTQLNWPHLCLCALYMYIQTYILNYYPSKSKFSVSQMEWMIFFLRNMKMNWKKRKKKKKEKKNSKIIINIINQNRINKVPEHFWLSNTYSAHTYIADCRELTFREMSTLTLFSVIAQAIDGTHSMFIKPSSFIYARKTYRILYVRTRSLKIHEIWSRQEERKNNNMYELKQHQHQNNNI